MLIVFCVWCLLIGVVGAAIGVNWWRVLIIESMTMTAMVIWMLAFGFRLTK